MEKISPVNPVFTQNNDQETQFNQKKKDDKQNTQTSKDSDIYERHQYSPYSMYNNKGQIYMNCIGRRLISMATKELEKTGF